MINVLVTGAGGQLGQALAVVSENQPEINFYFKTSRELDITISTKLSELFANHSFHFCINCAAYTAVDKAELEEDEAFRLNATAVKDLASHCKRYNTTLIHISTDFVFDGEKSIPYTEGDIPNPKNVYGATKLKGEQSIQESMSNYFILRTSWIYSAFGNNFVRTMLKLGSEKERLTIVSDQIGAPTYANDLAEVIIRIVRQNSRKYGIYHYCGNENMSWFDFAVLIFDATSLEFELSPITSEDFKTAALRPKYSVLNNNKIYREFQLGNPNSEISMRASLNKIIQANELS